MLHLHILALTKLSCCGTCSGGVSDYIMCVPGHGGTEVTPGTTQPLSEMTRKVCLVLGN